MVCQTEPAADQFCPVYNQQDKSMTHFTEMSSAQACKDKPIKTNTHCNHTHATEEQALE